MEYKSKQKEFKTSPEPSHYERGTGNEIEEDLLVVLQQKGKWGSTRHEELNARSQLVVLRFMKMNLMKVLLQVSIFITMRMKRLLGLVKAMKLLQHIVQEFRMRMLYKIWNCHQMVKHFPPGTAECSVIGERSDEAHETSYGSGNIARGRDKDKEKVDEKLEDPVDPVQAMLLHMIPHLDSKPTRTEDTLIKDDKPEADTNPSPIKKKKVSYKDVAGELLKDW